MSERSINEIKDEIERVRELLKTDKGEHSVYGKGKLSGLYFALGKKLNFDSEEIEDE